MKTNLKNIFIAFALIFGVVAVCAAVSARDSYACESRDPLCD